jgi:hypothetical protein
MVNNGRNFVILSRAKYLIIVSNVNLKILHPDKSGIQNDNLA